MIINEIHIKDGFGSIRLRFLKLPDQMYFGGDTNGPPFMANGPQYYYHPASMLDLIASIASKLAQGEEWGISATDAPPYVPLGPKPIRADDLAEILGIETSVVLDRFSLLVKLDQPAPA